MKFFNRSNKEDKKVQSSDLQSNSSSAQSTRKSDTLQATNSHNRDSEGLKKLSQAVTDFVETSLGLNKEKLLSVTIDDKAHCTIYFPFVVNTDWPALKSELSTKFSNIKDFTKRYNIPIFAAQKRPIKHIKNIIAVASGKGGVGKSASALNLAIALKNEGARVGILDADIYGPSIPIMLGTMAQKPESPDNKMMIPINAHGLVSNSIGYLVDNEHASIWRGPMASKALSQLLNETAWPTLDYLIVDMPPGTGDIQLTMCQQLPLTAAVVVTTPQDIALSDAGKGIAMFDKLNIPVLGLLENMSFFSCPKCHHTTEIFSSNGGRKLSEKYALPLLAQMPLDPIIREFADTGRSIIDENPAHDVSQLYCRAARMLSRTLCEEAELMNVVANMASSIEVTQLD